MLNLCGIVVAILKMAVTTRGVILHFKMFEMSAIFKMAAKNTA
jgi:hypothetical protein